MERNIKLSEIKSGQKAVIKSIDEKMDVMKHKRLLELGFVKNTIVYVIKNSGFSKLLLVGIRGYSLSLDYKLASQIYVYGDSLCKK